MPTLLTLPKELQLQVAEHLILKIDQKNLCLVCKELRDVGTQILYNNMAISVKKLNKSFQQFIATTENHSGLRHVRTLCVARTGGGELMTSYHTKMIYQLLSVLPRDTLTRFQLPDLMRHDDGLARLLWTRQRKLINYQYHSPGRDAVPAVHFLPSGDELSCVTMVQLRIVCKNDCEQAGTILKRTPRATSLAVAVSRLDLEMNSELYSCSRVVIGRFVVETIFRMAYAQHGQLKLTALRFDTICLVRVGDRLQEFIALEGLQHLQLLRCSGNDSFLQVLSDKCYDLQSFVVEECRDVAHNNAINDFLRATTPRQLVYRSEHCGASSANAQGLITFDALFPFAHAIQGLVLRDCDPNFSVYGPQRTGGSLIGFEELCESLQSLKLLCIASPAVERMHWAIGGFTDFLAQLQHLRQLRVLKLVVSDYCRPQTVQSYQEAADEIFKVLSRNCPQLIVVIFERRTLAGIVTRSFVRKNQIDHHAPAKFLGIDVAPCVIEDYAPCSDMLEPEKLIFG